MTTFKTVKIATMSAVILGALATNSVAAFAEETKELKSKGHVSFVEDTDPNNPVDPIDPGEEEPGEPINPIDPEEPMEPGTEGPLSLDFASHFNFGEQKISTKNQTYNAAPQQFKDANGELKDRPNYVQVTDKRAEQTGWKLSVVQDAQFKAATSGAELKGAQISLNNAEVVTASEGAKPSTVQEKVDLVPGVEQAVMASNVEEGFGTWVYRFGNEETMNESVQLSVPGSSVKNADSYDTKLTWKISDTPDNNVEA